MNDDLHEPLQFEVGDDVNEVLRRRTAQLDAATALIHERLRVETLAAIAAFCTPVSTTKH